MFRHRNIVVAAAKSGHFAQLASCAAGGVKLNFGADLSSRNQRAVRSEVVFADCTAEAACPALDFSALRIERINSPLNVVVVVYLAACAKEQQLGVGTPAQVAFARLIIGQ